MSITERPRASKCSLCGVTEQEHQELYGTPLGHLSFSFQPDKGPALRGEAMLCRPCTHGTLPRRLLHAAGVSDDELAPDVWN
jgi:hypothetical protein